MLYRVTAKDKVRGRRQPHYTVPVR